VRWTAATRSPVADVLIVAGEPSGEEHALSFLPRLKELRPELRFWGVGGDRLQAEGMELKHHLKTFSSMGFSEVIGKVPFYRRALLDLVAEAKARGTKDAILVDFQDFNLRLAQRLAKHGIRVWYYVAPQAWGWRAYRAGILARTVQRLFTILPFEERWFRERGVAQVTPVPHPLTANWSGPLARLPARPWEPRLQTAPRLMVLPGSRLSEVRPLLPLFVRAVKELRTHCPGLQVTIARVPHLDPAWYDVANGQVDRWITPEELPEALLTSDLALAASGTVTLGTGLMGVPTVVAYQSSLLNEFVLRRLIRYTKPISLTNLVLEEVVFPEYTQAEVQPSILAEAMLRWLRNPPAWNHATEQLATLPGRMQAGVRDVGALLAREMT
jgi:lipid-A-disaccharide synthase